MARDFNNLLVGILGNIGLARMDLEASHPARSAVDAIESAGLHAARLVRKIQAYSEREQHMVQRVELENLLPRLRTELDEAAAGAPLRLEIVGPLPAINADISQLRRAVSCLVTNAAEASPPGASIRVRVSAVEVAPAAPRAGEAPRPVGPHIALDICDAGEGMNAQAQAQAFDPFYSTRGAGRGLGLPMVQEIVREHGGALVVVSAPGAGTTVRLLLPQAPSLAAPAPVAPARARLVLVVDDEPTVLEVARGFLESAGFEVVCASTGREGVSIYESRAVEIGAVLMDATLPDISGLDALVAMQRQRPVRALLTSGYVREDYSAQFAASGVVSFLPKPWRGHALIAAMTNLFEE